MSRAGRGSADILPDVTTSSGERRLAPLDGLRGAFASLLLLYHFGLTWLVGGWVTLNHFFVFSGYLITRLLISERRRSGRIDPLAFYRRRAERLVPALLVLTAAITVHAVLQPAALRQRLGGDVLATLGFAQNWRLIAREDAYFDQVGQPSPLQHAWTLGVEEQFYVLIPWIVLALFIVCRTARMRTVVVALAALAATGWTAWLATSGAGFPRLYYGTDSRAAALLVGVGTAFLLSVGGRRRRGGASGLPLPQVQAIGVVGLVLSVLPILVVRADSTWVFDRGGALLFALAASMVFVAVADKRPMTLTRALSWRPIVVLGQMTYGLYIYHWPINLWLDPHLHGLPLALGVVLKFALTVVVAAVSYRYLESRVLLGGFGSLLPRRWPARRAWIVPVAGAAVIALAAVTMWRVPAAQDPLDVPPLEAGQGPFEEPEEPVTFGLLGDSVGASLADGWRGGRYPGVTMVNQSRIGCDLIDAPVVHDGERVPGGADDCHEWRDEWPGEVEDAGVTDLVVLAGTQFMADHEVEDGVAEVPSGKAGEVVQRTLDETERKAREHGVERVHVVTMPCRDIEAARLDPRFRFFAEPASDPDNVDWVNETITDWSEHGDGRSVIDLWEPLCGDGGYRAEINGVPLYHDTVHFSRSGAAMVWTWLTPQVVSASGQ